MQNEGIRVRVSDLLFAFQKRWDIIVALSLVGLVFGLILSAMTYVQSSFQSFDVKGSFAVTTINDRGNYINNAAAPNNNDFYLAEDMMDAVTYIIRSDRVLNEVINDQEMLGYSARQMRSAINLTQYNTTQIMEMSFTWRNAEEGIAIWNAIVEATSSLLPQTLQLGSLAVINEAQAELLGVVGNGGNLPVLLTMLGFVAGVGYAVIELLMHPTLNNVWDVQTMFGLETIGVIPRDNAYYKRKGSILVQDDAGSSTVVQNFSAAAYILRNRLGTKEKHHCFYVTSAIAQEGKSTVAANLAIQLSDMEHHTLLIDFDTRNPSLGTLFLDKVDYARSLNALYRGEATEEEAITTLTGYLDILPAVLEHNAMMMDGTIVELFQRLCEKYEYVILDAPPVGQVSDTLSLNQIASTVLYVIGYDHSTIPEIQNALDKLDKSGIRVLGCIVNGAQSAKNMFSKDKNTRDKKKHEQAKDNEEAMEALPEQVEPIDGLVKSTGRLSKRKAKGKEIGRRRKKHEKGAPTNENSQEMGARPEEKAVVPFSRKNLMDDLMEAEEVNGELADEDAVTALLKLGIEGEDVKTGADGDEPEADENPVAAEIAEEEPVPAKEPPKKKVEETPAISEPPVEESIRTHRRNVEETPTVSEPPVEEPIRTHRRNVEETPAISEPPVEEPIRTHRRNVDETPTVSEPPVEEPIRTLRRNVEETPVVSETPVEKPVRTRKKKAEETHGEGETPVKKPKRARKKKVEEPPAEGETPVKKSKRTHKKV